MDLKEKEMLFLEEFWQLLDLDMGIRRFSFYASFKYGDL